MSSEVALDFLFTVLNCTKNESKKESVIFEI